MFPIPLTKLGSNLYQKQEELIKTNIVLWYFSFTLLILFVILISIKLIHNFYFNPKIVFHSVLCVSKVIEI
jgi:hypothetical protein